MHALFAMACLVRHITPRQPHSAYTQGMRFRTFQSAKRSNQAAILSAWPRPDPAAKASGALRLHLRPEAARLFGDLVVYGSEVTHHGVLERSMACRSFSSQLYWAEPTV